MSLPNPSFDIINSRTPIGSADTNAATAKVSSSPKLLLLRMQRTTTAIMAAPPETPVTIGVMWVMSRTGCPHIVSVEFCAATRINKLRILSGRVRTYTTPRSRHMRRVHILGWYPSSLPSCIYIQCPLGRRYSAPSNLTLDIQSSEVSVGQSKKAVI